jgi:L-amino acid N-acyltransferase YncA
MRGEIRFATVDDAEAIRAIYGPYCESTCVSFEDVAPSIDQMRERIGRIGASYPWLVAEIDGRVGGYVYASRHHERAGYRWSVDVAVYLSSAFHRRGLGKTLYATLFAILREQGFFKAYAGVSLPNAASVGLHEHVGFEPVGIYRGAGYKFGRWVDVGWWQLGLQPERDEPADPRPIVEVRDSDPVKSALIAGNHGLTAVLGLIQSL